MNATSTDLIRLKGGACHVTHNGEDAYRVVSGSVLVYIVPWADGEMGRRSLLREVRAGQMVPAFACQDMDYHSWRFCFAAVDEAELERMPGMCTKPLQNRFLRESSVPDYEREGYDNALVNRYRMNLVREDGFLLRTDREKTETLKKTDQLIASLFAREKPDQKQAGEETLYQVAAELCHRAKIRIAPYEQVRACYGQKAEMPDIARVSHFPCREIVLEENWHTADAGFLLVFLGEEREPAACIPHGRHGYILYRSGEKTVKLTKGLSERCQPKAYMIYRSLPQTSMTGRDFAVYCVQGLPASDLLAVFLLTVVSSLIGLLLPALNQMLYDQFIPMGDVGLIIRIGGLIAAFMAGNIAFSIVKSVGAFRLDSHIRYQVQSAVYYRVFELPEKFFREQGSADLAGRIMELGELASQASRLALSLGLGLVSAVFYLCGMFAYSVTLSLIAIGLTLVFSAVSYCMALRQLNYQAKIMALAGRSDSVLYQFLRGIEKIRIAGIEDRAVYEYMRSSVEQRRARTDMAKISAASAAVSMIGGGILTAAVCFAAYRMPDISMGQFVAFSCAFGMMSSMISGLVNGLVGYQMLGPAYDRVRAVFQTAPETNEGKILPGEITGKIDVDHISFSYGGDLPPVFSDLDLHIAPGEYLGIVGASGCGKSTLLKLLLGFERPSSGKIYYDDQDMEELDLQQLRRRFGVVLQDGELISGNIYENIALTAPWATYREVREAAAAVGLDKDIESMPMGFQTLVSENCNTISGGQKQRILIARAIMNHPQIIFFDEATSALDNINQSMVCGALEQMDGVTRIIIAHRLSTIRNCGRILVFDHGDVVEEGDFESLMRRQGLFYRLASRQLPEDG